MISKADIKHIRSLQRKKFRDQHSEFVIEGFKLLEEVIHLNPSLINIVYTTAPGEIKREKDLNVVEVSPKELSQISSLRSPQPFVSICKKLDLNIIDSPLVLALDDIQDPGNMGTILRLAAWFGIDDIIVSQGCVDIYNPKVVQASMGGVFTVNVTPTDLKTYLSETNKPVFGALLEGKNIYKEALPKEGVILMGNEGNGISEELLPLISRPISIPKFGSGESLNVAMATGILLSEFRRRE